MIRTRPATTNPVGILLIGCGYWGRNYVRVFDELPGTEVAAICDGSLDRLQAIGTDYPRTFLTTSLDEALDRPDVSAAVICTPAATHHDVAARCLQAGLPVLVEKPLTTTAHDADDLIALAAESDLTLMVGHTFLFNTGVRKVKELVSSGHAGDIYYLYAQRTSLGPVREDVNALWDLAPHDISIFNYILGLEPEWVTAVGSCVLGSERPDVGFITLGYPQGIVGHIHVSWVDPHKVREVVVVGSAQRIVFNDTNPLERVRVFDKGIARVPGPAGATYGEFTYQLRNGDIFSPVVESAEPLKSQCVSFLQCVRTGRKPSSDGHLGRHVVTVMEAIDRSLLGGGHPVAVASDATVTTLVT